MYNLLKLREKAKITQASICEVLHVDSKTYRGYEKGGVIPSDVCLKLVEYYSGIFGYKVSIDYLLGRVDSPYTDNCVNEFMELSHLSESAISNILYEGSEKGNNQRVFMLDLLLSDKDTFVTLIDGMFSLLYPSGYYYTSDIIKRTDWMKVGEDGSVSINPTFFQTVSDSMPDNVFRRMRSEIELFNKRKKGKIPSYFAPNEFHPFESVVDYTSGEED